MKSFLQRLLLVAFGLVISLVMAEILVRLFLSTASKGAEWNDRPKYYVLQEGAETARDYRYPPVKAPGTFRIAVVGDSFSFAPFMQFDTTFAKQLERMLNLNRIQPKMEVINYGVPRYSTSHEVALVERAIREQADLILLQITLNDPEIKPYRPTGLIGGAVDRFGALNFEDGLLAHWKSAAFVVTRWYNAQSKSKYIQYFLDLFDKPETWKNFEQSVRKIDALTHAGNVRLVGVLFPLFGLPLDQHYPFRSLHEKVNGLLESLKIPHLDLYSNFAGIPLERIQTIPRKDFHPNEIGHRIAAESILEFLAAQHEIPAESVPTLRLNERTDIRIDASRQVGGAASASKVEQTVE